MPERCRALLPQPHDDLRRARRRLHLHVARTRHAREHAGHRLRIAIEQIQIVAVQIDHHRRGEAGDGLFDALGEKRVDGERHAGETRRRACPINVSRISRRMRACCLPSSAPISTSNSL